MRDGRSHIRSDGTAKATYPSEEAAAQVANLVWLRTGKPTGFYLCSQRPDHWHIGSGTPDIDTKETK